MSTENETTQYDEARRQSPRATRNLETEPEGSHGIDHGTVYDNAESPDTNHEPAEDIIARNSNDLSFWGGKWTWNRSATSYGDKPEDRWFINPSPQLIGQVMNMAPTIHESCRLVLETEKEDELNEQRERFLEFLRGAYDSELVSECLDYLTAYQGRFFEAVQQYLGRLDSYDAATNRDDQDEERIEQLRERKVEAARQCRGWTAKLIALVEAYHTVVTDERAYNLQYNFDPKEGTSQYNLYRYSVTQAMNRIGRRLTRSVKNGSMDADQYRIPKPWTDEDKASSRRKANEMLSDFA